MNILSLFDGMGCGRIALERAGIKIDNYYAFEIDKYAMKVSNHNYPDIIHLGDVTDWRLYDLPKIDLIIGGSPCQGFSFAGKQLAFDDPRSKLFFTMVEIINHYKPKYFLLENVKMKKEYLDIIDDYMGVHKRLINSSSFSAQDRKRYYWTNISIPEYKENNLLIDDILESNIDEKYYIKPNKEIFLSKVGRKWGHIGTNSQGNRIYNTNYKGICLCTASGGLGGKTGLYLVDHKIRKLTPVECERLQTVPDGYTDVNISDNQRYKMLGNGWTVDVIAHIFKGLQ